MYSDKSDKRPLFFKIKLDNQAITIAFNIENNPAVFKYTCRNVALFDIHRIPPVGFYCILVPRFQILFRIGVFLPKFS